jgi:hypothetical protein
MSIFVFRRDRFRSLAFCCAAAAASSLLASCSGAGTTAPNTVAVAPQDASVLQQSEIGFAKTPAYRQVVLNDKPIADFPLDSKGEGSLVGGYTTALKGGATIVKGGPIKNQKNDHSLMLSGMEYATTSLSGGIPGTGTVVAWVNLSELPSTAGSYFYIAGESQGGNDFDVQFQNDNLLYFYTGGGENTSYAPPTGSLIGKWNMIAATYLGGSDGFRNIYWNGALAATVSGSVNSAPKTSQFNIGESLVFTGRYFQGNIGEVAVWDHALTAKQISAIYRASK